VHFNVAVPGYALNSGGGAVGAFTADANYAGSANTLSVTNSIDTSGTANPAPAAVYQSERWGEFTYVLNNLVPGSNYTVRIHLAEISPSVNGPGDRRFNLWLNGVPALSDFDLLAAAGAKFRAMTREFKHRADSSGTLQVAFTRGAVNEPKCSGLEVFGSAPPVAPRISARAATNSTVSLTWQTSPGGMYQVQWQGDLGQGGWTDLGTVLVATGTALSISDGLATAQRRFYRILLLN